MDLGLFKTTSWYPAILDKLFVSTLSVALGAVWLLCKNVAFLEATLSELNVPVPIDGLSVPIGYLLSALVVTLLFRIFKAHDLISDLFRIRSRFDVNEILLPLAGEAGLPMPVDKVERMRAKRQDLMRQVFYRYASGVPGAAKIDMEMIVMALDQWSWYWMLLEASAIILPCAVFLLVLRRALPAAWLLVAFVVLLGLMRLMMPLCIRYARREVKAIVEDDARRVEVKQVLTLIRK